MNLYQLQFEYNKYYGDKDKFEENIHLLRSRLTSISAVKYDKEPISGGKRIDTLNITIDKITSLEDGLKYIIDKLYELEKQILDKISSHKKHHLYIEKEFDKLTVSELAKKYNKSERTIFRILKEIREV